MFIWQKTYPDDGKESLVYTAMVKTIDIPYYMYLKVIKRAFYNKNQGAYFIYAPW